MRNFGLIFFVFCVPIASAELDHNLLPMLGKPAPDNFESVVLPDGSGLPSGAGSATEGNELYTKHCAACHGADGRMPGNAIAGGIGSLNTPRPEKTVGSYWPYASTLFDYINRAMPYGNEKSLSANEVYAVTAYVLHLNDIVTADTQLTEDNLHTIAMPNRDGFTPAPDYEPVQ